MNALMEAAGRAWCERMAKTLEVQHIMPNGRPYLDRYFAAGWSPSNKRSGPAIFLHHFLSSDPDTEVHSHPWGWSASLIIAGGYREQRCGPDKQTHERVYRPGDVNILESDDRHRVELLTHDCWSVFLAGNFEKMWEFSPRC